MQTELAAARMTLRHMVAAASGPVGHETTNEILVGRTLVAEAAVRTVEAAMAVAAGAGFFRALGLERLFRDVQAARYHPLRPHAQRRYTGRLALGLDLDD
jgi:alkylation response protein AidB-like acyl-CoA dehydrogenase